MDILFYGLSGVRIMCSEEPYESNRLLDLFSYLLWLKVL